MKKQDFDNLPRIAAIDFDGIIVSDKFPEIGEPNMTTMLLLALLKRNGFKLILWTSRDGKYLEDAVEFCKCLPIPIEFDAINENIKEVQELTGSDTRKVYANIYVDDRAVSSAEPLILLKDVGELIVSGVTKACATICLDERALSFPTCLYGGKSWEEKLTL